MGGLKDGRDVTVFGGALLSSERDRSAGKAHRHKENIIIFLLNYGFFPSGSKMLLLQSHYCSPRVFVRFSVGSGGSVIKIMVQDN